MSAGSGINVEGELSEGECPGIASKGMSYRRRVKYEGGVPSPADYVARGVS